MKKEGMILSKSHSPMLASDQMEQVKNYLEGGRKFESLTLDQLRDKWVMDFKTWRNTGDSKEMDDTAAELKLRNIEPPFERVQFEVAAMVEEFRRDGPDNPAVLAKIEEFHEALKRPRN